MSLNVYLISNPFIVMLVISGCVVSCLVYVTIRKILADKKQLKKRSNN